MKSSIVLFLAFTLIVSVFMKVKESSSTFTNQGTELIFVYDPIQFGTVKISYHDTKGTEISQSTFKTEAVGSQYTFQHLNIEGYTFKGLAPSSDPQTGTFTIGDQHIIFEYEKKIPVTEPETDAEDGGKEPTKETTSNNKELPKTGIKTHYYGSLITLLGVTCVLIKKKQKYTH